MFNPTPMQQQVFTLSWLASQAPSGNSEERGETPTGKQTFHLPWNSDELQKAIDHLNNKIPSWGWKVVWGPEYTYDMLVPDNAMFVAQQYDGDTPLNVYVIAIAGTYGLSLYDAQTEDLDIDPTPWTIKDDYSAQAAVTTGDMDGLKNLLLMGLPDNNIHQFLANKIDPKNDVTLYFTGHSLGGALAPMLMLALLDPASSLDTTKTELSLWQKVHLLATAGPSIGNQPFLDQFNKVFSPPLADPQFIWNGNDVVPHAWSKATMQQITDPNIYDLTFLRGSCVLPLISAAQANAAANQYVQFNSSYAFKQPLQPYGLPDSTDWTPDSQFLAQLGYQHLNAYIDAFQCSWFVLEDPCADPVKARSNAEKLCTKKLKIRVAPAGQAELSGVS